MTAALAGKRCLGTVSVDEVRMYLFARKDYHKESSQIAVLIDARSYKGYLFDSGNWKVIRIFKPSRSDLKQVKDIC